MEKTYFYEKSKKKYGEYLKVPHCFGDFKKKIKKSASPDSRKKIFSMLSCVCSNAASSWSKT